MATKKSTTTNKKPTTKVRVEKVKEVKVEKAVSKHASSMDELFKNGYDFKVFKRNEVVKGIVTEISGRSVFVNIGGKTEAVIGDKEYETSKDFIKALKVGDEMTATIVSPESDGGQIVLSVKRAIADSRWKIFEDALKSNATLSVKGKDLTKGGMLVEVEGVYGFVPTSQFSKESMDDLHDFVGQNFDVKVIEVDRLANRLVMSEKAVTEAVEIAKRRELLANFDLGAKYTGEIIGIVPFGVFVQVASGKGKKAVELEGLVHISEISWEKIDEIRKALKEGDKVDVKVIGTDEENGKLALSIKQLTPDPWTGIDKKYKLDSHHTGKVIKIMPYGILVHVERGIEGLIHASKMPTDKAFKEGDEVEVFVESLDIDKRRLSLGVISKDTKGIIYK